MASGPEGGTYLAIRLPDGTELLAREVGTRRQTWHERLDPATGAWVGDRSLAAWFSGERPGGRGLSSGQALGLAAAAGGSLDVVVARPLPRLLGRDRTLQRSILAILLLLAVVAASLTGRATAAPGQAVSVGAALWNATPALAVGLLVLYGSWPVVYAGLAGLLAYGSFDASSHAHPPDETVWDGVWGFVIPPILALVVLALGFAEAFVRIVVLAPLWRFLRPRLSRRAAAGSA